MFIGGVATRDGLPDVARYERLLRGAPVRPRSVDTRAEQDVRLQLAADPVKVPDVFVEDGVSLLVQVVRPEVELGDEVPAGAALLRAPRRRRLRLGEAHRPHRVRHGR